MIWRLEGRLVGRDESALVQTLSLKREDTMRLEEALDRYLTQLRADGRSAHTAGQYRRHIALLGSWLREHGRSDAVEKIDHETLAQFLSSPSARTRPDGKTKKATSANALRTSLRTFFRYAHEAGYTQSNPARLVRRALCGTPPIGQCSSRSFSIVSRNVLSSEDSGAA